MLLGEKCANYGDMGHASEQGLSERISDRRIQRETLGSRTGQTVVGGSGGLGDVDRSGSQPGNSAAEGNRHRDSAYTASFWADCEWLYCRDGKMRPTQPQLFPLAHGIANRVGKLRGYGNALVAPQAEAFVRAYLQVSEVVGRS
jgi:DNA (cytosine-5)-methyltransferase 1